MPTSTGPASTASTPTGTPASRGCYRRATPACSSSRRRSQSRSRRPGPSREGSARRPGSLTCSRTSCRRTSRRSGRCSGSTGASTTGASGGTGRSNRLPPHRGFARAIASPYYAARGTYDLPLLREDRAARVSGGGRLPVTRGGGRGGRPPRSSEELQSRRPARVRNDPETSGVPQTGAVRGHLGEPGRAGQAHGMAAAHDVDPGVTPGHGRGRESRRP
jgi:hypothetical protein